MSYIPQDSTLRDRVEGASIRESKIEEEALKMMEWREKQEKEFRIRVTENRKITSKIDSAIDPSNKEKVKLAQQYFNIYVLKDDVLPVDGIWGPETQKAFEKYRRLKKFSTSFSSVTDFRDMKRRYLENKEIKRLKVQGALEIDDAMQEMQEIDAPLFEE